MTHLHEHTQGEPKNYRKAFALGIGLNVIYIVVEIVYGLLANSSALLADAGHNASDVLGLVFAWTAMWLATLKPTGKYTYGLRKTTILVSILNALLLFGAVAVIAWDAIGKFKNPEPVAGSQVMMVAGIGVVINTLTALLFMKGQKDDLNIKGAFLHMAADAGVSVGVVVSGLLIYQTGVMWIDPVTSFIILIVIVYSTWSLFTDSIDLALDAVPDDIDIAEVESFFEEKPEIESFHDLHIRAMSTTENALSVHLVLNRQADTDQLLKTMKQELRDKYDIGYSTIQTEEVDMEDSLGS